MAQISIADASPRVQYTVNSTPTTGPWAFAFPFFDLDDVLVYEDAVLQTRGVDYSLSGTAVDDGYSAGSVTWLANTSSVTLTFIRDVPVERTTDFPTSGYFNVASLNTALDKLFAVLQELETKLLRSVKLADTDASSTPGTLPAAVDGSGLYWNGTVLDNTTFDITSLGTSVTDAVAAKDAAETAQAAAELALDTFDDTYLGAKASDPTLDNDGNALAAGALYFNTTSDVFRVWDGAAFINAVTGVAGFLALTGGTMTGDIVLSGDPDAALKAATKQYVDTFVPLAGGTLTGEVVAADQLVTRPKLKDYSETVNAIGSTGGGTQDVDYALGNVASLTVDTSANTLTVSNWPASGSHGSLTLYITNGGSQTFNWPAAVDWAGGTAPTLTAAGVDVITLTTLDAGTTIYGFAGGLAMA